MANKNNEKQKFGDIIENHDLIKRTLMVSAYPALIRSVVKDGDTLFEGFLPEFEFARIEDIATEDECVEYLQDMLDDEVEELVVFGKSLPNVAEDEKLLKDNPDYKIVYLDINVYATKEELDIYDSCNHNCSCCSNKCGEDEFYDEDFYEECGCDCDDDDCDDDCDCAHHHCHSNYDNDDDDCCCTPHHYHEHNCEHHNHNCNCEEDCYEDVDYCDDDCNCGDNCDCGGDNKTDNNCGCDKNGNHSCKGEANGCKGGNHKHSCNCDNKNNENKKCCKCKQNEDKEDSKLDKKQNKNITTKNNAKKK